MAKYVVMEAEHMVKYVVMEAEYMVKYEMTEFDSLSRIGQTPSYDTSIYALKTLLVSRNYTQVRSKNSVQTQIQHQISHLLIHVRSRLHGS